VLASLGSQVLALGTRDRNKLGRERNMPISDLDDLRRVVRRRQWAAASRRYKVEIPFSLSDFPVSSVFVARGQRGVSVFKTSSSFLCSKHHRRFCVQNIIAVSAFNTSSPFLRSIHHHRFCVQYIIIVSVSTGVCVVLLLADSVSFGRWLSRQLGTGCRPQFEHPVDQTVLNALLPQSDLFAKRNARAGK
jgi:hypothetical protein